MVTKYRGALIPWDELTTNQKLRYFDWSAFTIDEIAQELCVSRSAVQMGIARLKQRGVQVQVKPAKVFCKDCKFHAMRKRVNTKKDYCKANETFMNKSICERATDCPKYQPKGRG